MNKQQFYECERRRLKKYQKYLLLPNYFKKIGLAIFIITLVFLLGFGFFVEGNQIVKDIARHIILISLLLFALSGEEIEDEMIEKLRGQAFSFAFIAGVIFTIVQPYINYLMAAILKPEKAVFAEMGDFVILWFMLFVYLCFFSLLKRTS